MDREPRGLVIGMGGNDSEPPTVLIVEDERGVADLYELWLSDDYEVRTAYDGDGALGSLDESVRVVLLDRRMPDLSGDEVLDRIRERKLDCCVAIASAVEPDFDVLEMGFDDYVRKPISEGELHETVARMVSLARYDRDVREYYALVSKKATLDAEKSASELEANEEYASLEAEIDDSSDRFDAELGDLPGKDLERMFRETL